MTARRPTYAAAVAAALAATAAAGCANVRAARAVQDPASAVPGERTPTAQELGLPRTGPVALRDVVRAALGAHPSVHQARRSAEAAGARVRQAEAAWLPQLSVNASHTVSDEEDAREPGRRRFHSHGFDLSWLLFDFGRTDALARQSAEQALAAQADLRATEADVAFGARSAYFELAKQLQLVVVGEDTVRQFEKRLEDVRERERVGQRIPYDVTKAEVDLANARLELIKARDAVLTAQANLANAVGLAEVLDWQPVTGLEAGAEPPVFDAAWEDARRNRPSLAAAEARELAASALVDARVAELYPTIEAGAGASMSGGPRPLQWAWDLGPRVRWVPFDGFANLASIDEQVALLRAARAARAEAEQTAWLDVRTAWIAIEDARRRLDLTTLTIRAAEENLALAEGRFEVGVGTSVELTDAQQALTAARAEDVQARADRAIAAARLRRALGETTGERAAQAAGAGGAGGAAR